MPIKKINWLIYNLSKPQVYKLLLAVIAVIAVLQTYWLMPRHFTQVDDIGVAESLMIRNLDYRDNCEKNLQEFRGRSLLVLLRNPDRVCQITAKLNRLSIIPSLWTYAPLQFWLTQAFLSPSKSYSYDEVKYWGRLPSFIFYVLGVLSFYALIRTQFRDFKNRPLLVISMALLVCLSLQERIHAAQMHSYAIGILVNSIVIFGYIKLCNLSERNYFSIVAISTLFAIAIGMQYQATLLVVASLGGIFVSRCCARNRLDSDFLTKFIFLASITGLITFAIVGNILGFSSGGVNWNAGPNREFLVTGHSLLERLISFFSLIIFQAPENFYSIISALQLPDWAANLLGITFLIFMVVGAINLWGRRGVKGSRDILMLICMYLLIYLAFIFAGKLTFSPTRHILFYLPVAVILIGYGVLAVRSKRAIEFLKLIFLGYCTLSIAGFLSFSEARIDKVSDGFFNSLLQKSNSSFLIFDGPDIEPIFTEAKIGEPIFWFAPGAFDCANKEILVPKSRILNFITYGKYFPLELPNLKLDKYIRNIIADCTSHTSAIKEVVDIQGGDYLINSHSTTSVEFSSRVLNAISINNQFIQHYQAKLNFDSNLYAVTLAEGIDFSRESYPEFLKFVSGMAQREGWGRWTDSNRGRRVLFGFVEPLPQRFILELKVVPFGPNIGKPTLIRVGDQEKTIFIDGKNAIFYLEFQNRENIDVVEIIAPTTPLVKDGALISSDPRNIGVGLQRLKIKEVK